MHRVLSQAYVWVPIMAPGTFFCPTFASLRPRPEDDYASAREEAMTGNWEPTVRVFHRMLTNFFHET